MIVFGIDLTVLLRREHQGEEPPPGSIPIFLQVCLAEVEARGYSETGICERLLFYMARSLINVQTALLEPSPRSTALSMHLIKVPESLHLDGNGD
jgi:hypothetical protein